MPKPKPATHQPKHARTHAMKTIRTAALCGALVLLLQLPAHSLLAQDVTSEAELKRQLGLDKPTPPKTRSTRSFRGAVKEEPQKIETRTSVVTTRSLNSLQTRGTRGAIKIKETSGDTAKVEVPVVADVKATFNNILFVRGSTEFADEASREQVATIAKVIAGAPNKHFLIEGHASDDGSDVTNLRLSVARAEAIELFLLSSGVKEEQIIAQGFGESDQAFPVSEFDSPGVLEQKRQKNRRVEIRVQADE